jgi:lipopolysaccharide export LptBFGC system permease protein LptF
MCFCTTLSSAQVSRTGTDQNIVKIDAMLQELNTDFTVKKCNTVFDLAKAMSTNKNDEKQVKKGVNTMAYLAKTMNILVAAKSINLDSDDTHKLIQKFENEKYFIQLPKVSRFIKTMNYFCKGEYLYVHQKLVSTWYYKLSIILVSWFIILFAMSYSKKFNWKYKNRYRQIFLIILGVFLILFVSFKLTCQSGIEDYSFYGIII